MQTHIVPVGFDYDRLIAPLVRDQLDVDRVILLEGAVGSEANVEYSRNLAAKLEQDFRNLLGAETERFVVEDVYDYNGAFEQAYDLINAELDAVLESGDSRTSQGPEGSDDGREVWANVSAMPRTVSFAFATAAHSIAVERSDDRERIHTYYTIPEKYLETELAEELRQQIDLLSDLDSDDDRSTARATSSRSSMSAARPSARRPLTAIISSKFQSLPSRTSNHSKNSFCSNSARMDHLKASRNSPTHSRANLPRSTPIASARKSSTTSIGSGRAARATSSRTRVENPTGHGSRASMSCGCARTRMANRWRPVIDSRTRDTVDQQSSDGRRRWRAGAVGGASKASAAKRTGRNDP
jgi:hypothetical protein